MHSGRETSLASCLAARDNKLTMLVPIVENTGFAAAPRSYVCVCVRLRHTSECVYTCEREEREGSVSLGAVQQRNDSHFFRLPLRVLPNTRNVIWRCCSDPFSCSEGQTLSVSWWCSTVLVQWHTPMVTEKSLYSKDTRLPAPNKAPPNYWCPADVTEKRAEFVHMRGLGVAALMRKTHSEVMSLYGYIYTMMV